MLATYVSFLWSGPETFLIVETPTSSVTDERALGSTCLSVSLRETPSLLQVSSDSCPASGWSASHQTAPCSIRLSLLEECMMLRVLTSCLE